MLILMIVVIAKSLMGMVNKSTYLSSDKTLTAVMVGSIQVQFLIGLVLYIFLSPITEAAFADFGAAMKNKELRYFAVEHIFAMLVGVALAEIGKSKAKKATEDVRKFKTQLIFFSIALVVMLSRIPFDAERLFR